MQTVLDVWDILAIVAYFFLVTSAGIYAMCKAKRGTLSGYFLAGRYMTWLPVGASLFASNIGSEHFIGLAGSGAASGIAVGAFEFNALILLQLLGWVFIPVYIASKVCTLPEYMSKRFGGQRIRMFLATLSLILYIFTKISVNMYAGALFIKQTLGWNLYLSISLLLFMTALCTVTGGLTAVIYTDTMQCFVMLIGGTILMIRAFMEVESYSSLKSRYMEAIPNNTIPGTNCGHPRSDSWVMLRHPTESDMPWPGFIFGQTPASVWYWCADQMMVQRVLAAKSLSHAQGATIFTGYIKILPIFMIVIPGMISRILYPDIVGCVIPEECERYCESRLGCSNLAYPLLVVRLLPSGLRGIMLAVMLAALMSDLTSIFNSSSALFTIDIWQFMRPSAVGRELLIVGKVFILILVGISIAWIPLVIQMQGGQLYIYIQAIAAYLSPPIAAVYLTAVLWKRANEKGAFCGLMLGFVVGSVRMVLDFYYTEPACGEPDTRPAFITKVHYMYFAMILFWQTVLIVVIVSLLTKPLPRSMLIRTTYWTRFERIERNDDTPVDLQTQPEAFQRTNREYEEDNIVLEKSEPTEVDYRSGDKMEVDDLDPSMINDKKTYFALERMQENSHKKLTPETNGSYGIFYMTDECCTGSLKNEKVPVTQRKRCYKMALKWLCGSVTEFKRVKEATALHEHLESLACLKQDRKAKIFLNVNLFIILLVGLSLYIGFSVTGGV